MENINPYFDSFIENLKSKLLSKLNSCNKVYIFPHKNIDFDAAASAAAMSDLCDYLGIESYIVSDDNPENMKPSLSELYFNLENKYNLINSDMFKNLYNDDDFIIIVDTSVKNLLPINNIEEYQNMLIIDHHNPDDKTINCDDLLIDTEASSASEILFYLLKNMDIFISTETAQLLLAGIYLDTNGLRYMEDPDGFNTIAKLLRYGANLQDVRNLFTISNFEDDRKQERIINDLIDCTKFYQCGSNNFAITVNKNNPNTVYTDKQLAIATDKLLKYTVDAAFVMGYTDRECLGECHEDVVQIKARTGYINDTVDVSDIMNMFDGGGSQNRAACTIKGSNDIIQIKDVLKYILKNEIKDIDKKQIEQKIYTK